MYNSSQKEISMKRAVDYSDFGKPYNPISDPVDSCLPGSFLDNPKVAELGLCPSFMAQRCAMGWDDKCTLYVNSLKDQVLQRDFFKDVAGRKYCQLSPDSNCSTMCEAFDPIAQDSVKVCKYVGSEQFSDANASVDIGWYQPVNISPVYMGSCRQTCNKVNPKDITQDDPVINNCLKYGYCNDILTNICQLANNNNISIGHTGLSTYCSNLKLPSPIQPAQPTKENLTTYKRSYGKKKSYDGEFIFFGIFIVLVCIMVWMWYKKNKKSKK